MVKVTVNDNAFERLRSANALLAITSGDMQTVVLRRMANVHRQQEAQIFATEGVAGASGRWTRLSAAYAARKSALFRGGRAAVKGKKGMARKEALRAQNRPIANKILVWSGETKERFTRANNPHNIARVRLDGPARFTYQFGAESQIAAYHFDGTAKMPRRDMVTKTAAQLQALMQAIVDWYRTERLPQVKRFFGPVGGGQGSTSSSGIGGAVGRAASPTP